MESEPKLSNIMSFQSAFYVKVFFMCEKIALIVAGY